MEEAAQRWQEWVGRRTTWEAAGEQVSWPVTGQIQETFTMTKEETGFGG